MHDHHKQFSHVVFSVDGVEVTLIPGMRLEMAVTVSVGHKINLSIAYLDTNGNPMLVPPTPDTPPTWANTTSATDTLTVGGGGLTAVATPIAPGSDVINMDVFVAGVDFKASLAVQVDAAPQVLGSVQIVATVV